ncbi:hypothetical protein ABFV80_001010 [Vandammella animalimorsus]|uniref:hypothetical protein n=1 Tax=Vandammella animalimorsus TaxID=2029117 RepID=UPI00325B2311
MNPNSVQGQHPGLPSTLPLFFGGIACFADHPAKHSSIQAFKHSSIQAFKHSSIQLARRMDACLPCVQHKRLALLSLQTTPDPTP